MRENCDDKRAKEKRRSRFFLCEINFDYLDVRFHIAKVEAARVVQG